MSGTILNLITVAIGSALGLFIGNRLPEKIQQSVVNGLGLVTFYVGVSNVSATGNIIIPLLSLALGIIIGELLDIESALERFGGWLESKASSNATSDDNTDDKRARFIKGFVTTSLLFCVGPLAFVGSLMDGMGLPLGFQQLAIKSVLDGFASMAFAASLGVGVAFSLISVLIYQGGLALIGMLLVGGTDTTALSTAPAILEMTAVGGLVLMGLALMLLDIRKLRIANFLPALLIAPLLVWLASILGINIYPL